MLRRRKLKPIQLDPAVEAWHAQEHEKLVQKATRIMKTFDALPPVVRQAFTVEPTGGIMTSDAKQLADKITRGELPVDHAYLANHIVMCGETNYRKFMDEAREEMERRPVAVFRKKKPAV